MCSSAMSPPLAMGTLVGPSGLSPVQTEQGPAVAGEANLRMPVSGAAVIRSKYRGLSWDKKHQGWRVRIYFSGKQRHVGRFEDDVAAAKAYDKAAVYLYGSNAITNFGLEACQVDPTEVSTFIVLAKEQAEQEQLARNHHRQHYASMQQHLGVGHAGFSSGYALPQQVYMTQQQQPQQQQHAGMVFAAPQGMAQQPAMASPAWPNAAAAAGGYGLGQPSMAVMQGGLPQQQGSPHHHHQQQQQVWAPVANTMPGMLQQQAGMQPVGQVAYLDPSTAAGQQYPAGGYVIQGPAQGMQAGLGSPAASTAMLLNVQPQLQQQQQYLPAQQQGMVAAGGYASTLGPQVAASVAAVSACPAGAPMAMAGPQQMGSGDACGIGGSTFVQEMLHSLDFAAAGGQGAGAGAAAALVPHSMGWLAADGQQVAASWAMAQTPLGGGQAFPVAPAAMPDNSPSFSATSSTSANTNTSFALPRMGPVSSGV